MKPLALLIIAVGCCVTAHAASFDCRKAVTPQEKAICASPELSKADERMAAAYHAELAAAPPEAAPDLREGQRVWLKTISAQCARQQQQTLTACLQEVTDNRIKVLRAAVYRRGGTVFVTHELTLTTPDTTPNPVPDIEQTPGMGTLEISYPQASGSTPQWKRWNAAVVAAVQKFAGDTGDSKTGWSPSMAADTDSTITAGVEFADARLVSTDIEEEGMGHGAAHPFEDAARFHWLLAEGRELRVSDVFGTGTAWKTVVTARCRAALQRQYTDGMMYGEAETRKAIAETISKPENWKLSTAGLTIVFPEYTVAPRLENPDDVTIPWAALQPYLAPGFVRPATFAR